MYPALDLQDTIVPVCYATGFKVRRPLLQCSLDDVKQPFPGPMDTMEMAELEFRRLPSFLTQRVKEYGYNGHGSDHRFDMFIGVPFECREAIIASYLRQGLSCRENLVLMLRLEVKELERMEQLWRSFEDCLLFSSPENFCPGQTGPVRRIFDWFVGSYVHAGFESTLKLWKDFCNMVKQKALQAVDCKPSIPKGFPWFDTATGSLSLTGIVWLDRVYRRGCKSKSEGTRLMHLISSRGAPCPNFEMKVKSLLQHQITMRSVPQPETYESLIGTFHAGRAIGERASKRLGGRNLLSTEHVSLTNSSCYENPRSKGGRASYAQTILYEWANRLVEEDTSMTCLLGHEVHLTKGKKFWQCFNPVAPLSEEELRIDAEFGEPMASDQYMPRRYGFNRNLGYALLQCAYDDGRRKGCFGPNLELLKPIKKRAVALGEPGGKSRSLTIGEWFETILLQPLGHILVESLNSLPECTAGLSKGDPLWRFLQNVEADIRKGAVNAMYADAAWLKSSDLDKATDHVNRENAKYLLCGYLAGLGRNYTNNFLLFSVDLLVGPREVSWSLV